jgi:uncharacterized alpha-E superfamily protein
MISRVADHCFWLGRYLERAESTARMLFVTRNLALDGELTPQQCWQPAVIVSGEVERFQASFGADAAGDAERVQNYLTWDATNPSSIWRSIAAARENARSIREVVSLESWETINEIHLYMTSGEGRREYEHSRYGFYKRIRHSVQLTLGLFRSTMLHDEPLEFIWLGVLLERVGQTARTLDVHHHALTALNVHRVIETSLWLTLLRACSGFEPFMKRQQGRVTRDAVAGFLILEPNFPRSVRYCLQQAARTMFSIRPPTTGGPGGKAQARLNELNEWLATVRPPLPAAEIHGLLTRVVNGTAEICEEVSNDLIRGGVADAGQ